MARVTVKAVWDNKAIDARLKKARTELIGDVKREYLNDVIDLTVRLSPVDTGTYILNHQIGSNYQTNPNRTSDVSSKGKPRKSKRKGYNPLGPAPEREEAKVKLMSQLEGVIDSPKIRLINNANHSSKVEYTGWKKTGPYMVYTQIRAAAPQMLQDAIRRAKSK